MVKPHPSIYCFLKHRVKGEGAFRKGRASIVDSVSGGQVSVICRAGKPLVQMSAYIPPKKTRRIGAMKEEAIGELSAYLIVGLLTWFAVYHRTRRFSIPCGIF